MLEDVLRQLNEVDAFAAVAVLAAHGDHAAALATAHDLVLKLFNELKNVPAMLAIGLGGVHLGLHWAALEPDAAKAADLKGKAKGISYNLASFAWPGWDDDGIAITQTDVALGLEAAKANLRLAQELQRPALPLSRAYWVLGAQWLANGDPAAAKTAFGQAAHHARAADNEGEALLSEAYALLVDVLGGADQTPLTALLKQLAEMEHGAFFVGQVETARRVFSM